ncbi:MAG: ATP-binding protein, partial [Cyanobacteria bacterium J06627_15]
NAFKFSEPANTVQVPTHGTAQELVLEINNYGRGLTEEQCDRIAAYQQFDRNYYEQQGLGLGLVIARTLTEFNDGNFEIHSVIDGQTTVSVSLPLHA